MKILIDIGHPAHVHYFKNFIKIMIKKGHRFIVFSRDKEVAHYLLEKFEIQYFNRGSGSKTILGKLIYVLKADFIIMLKSLKFKPDLFLSFGSIYPAHVSFIMRKPNISFDDTEHSVWQYRLYSHFTKIVFTPISFRKNLGKKQIRFNGFMELCYLHPNYFTPNKEVLNLLGVNESEKYIILRFVSWNASHDKGHIGMKEKMKIHAIKELSKYARVFVSSESRLPKELDKYRITIPPEWIHDALYFASLFMGESGTMTSESAMLGTPAIQISGLPKGTIGTLAELEEYGLIKVYTKFDEEVLTNCISMLSEEKSSFGKKRTNLLNNKIDVTKFMVDFFINKYS